MVSLNKLTNAILSHHIDSYWLLLIRFQEGQSSFQPHVKLVSILDYLDFMHFDSGPGQIMLRSDAFYKHLADGDDPTELDSDEGVGRLLEMRRDGDKRLTENRANRLRQLEASAEAFEPTLPVDQTELKLIQGRQ